jgi:hypothetical protein
MACHPASSLCQFIYDWQTLIAGSLAGVLALVAAFLTIWATIKSANREVEAAKAQTESTLLVERRRVAREGFAFAAMLEAAMKAVLDDIETAREKIKDQTNDRFETMIVL